MRLVTFQLLRLLYGGREETQSSLIHPYQTVGKPAKFWSLKGVRFEKRTLWVMVQIFHLNVLWIFRVLCETASDCRKLRPKMGRHTETQWDLAVHWLCWGRNKGSAKSICYLLNFVLCVCRQRAGESDRGKNSLLDFRQSFCPDYLIAKGVWRELDILENHFTKQSSNWVFPLLYRKLIHWPQSKQIHYSIHESRHYCSNCLLCYWWRNLIFLSQEIFYC